MTKNLCFYSGLSQWVSPYFSTQTGSEALLLVLQGKNIYRLDDGSEVYMGNQKPEGRMSASRA